METNNLIQKGSALNLRKSQKGFSLIELLVVIGIIGILAAVGIPLYKAQQDTAVSAVIKNNAFSIQKMVDNYIALGVDVTAAKLDEQIKIKGKKLPAACFTIESAKGTSASTSTHDATTIKSGNIWAVGFANDTNNCTELEEKFNGCIDSAGKISDDEAITTAACSGATDLNS